MVVAQCGGHDRPECAERRASRYGIGGVSRHQQRGPVAAPQRPFEIRRNLNREQHRPRSEQPVELRGAMRDVRDLEVAGVLQRREDGASDVARFLQQHGRRQVARRGVDGVAEQHELHQRDHDDHAERHAVALELDELLDQHRARAQPEAARRHGADGGHRTTLILRSLPKAGVSKDGPRRRACGYPSRRALRALLRMRAAMIITPRPGNCRAPAPSGR